MPFHSGDWYLWGLGVVEEETCCKDATGRNCEKCFCNCFSWHIIVQDLPPKKTEKEKQDDNDNDSGEALEG